MRSGHSLHVDINVRARGPNGVASLGRTLADSAVIEPCQDNQAFHINIFLYTILNHEKVSDLPPQNWIPDPVSRIRAEDERESLHGPHSGTQREQIIGKSAGGGGGAGAGGIGSDGGANANRRGYEPTYYRWRRSTAGCEWTQAKRLKELERENLPADFDGLVADQALDNAMLRVRRKSRKLLSPIP